MTDKKVSFIFTTYNAAKCIRVSLVAALAQDYENFEVVVVDDGSTDDTDSIVHGFNDPRLRYYRRTRIGRARALNEAIELARGSYIAINDADDLSFPTRLSYVMKIFSEISEPVLIGTSYINTTSFQYHLPPQEGSVSGPEQEAIQWITKSRLYRSNPFVHSTVVFPKMLWEQTGGYDEALTMCIDYDFFFRAMKHAKMALLPAPTVLYFQNTESYFKLKKQQEYSKALRQIRGRARETLELPFWTRALDVVPHYVVWKSRLVKWLSNKC